MAGINELNCAKKRKNVGFGSCVLDPKAISGSFEVPEDFELTEADLLTPETLREKLENAIRADNPEERIYPIHKFLAITDNSEETVFQTIGTTQVVIRDGNYRYTQQFQEGGLCLSNSLRTHNYQRTFWLHYDPTNLLMGGRKVKADGSVVIAGMPAINFHQQKMKLPTQSEAAGYIGYWEFAPEYFNEAIGFSVAGFPLSELKGLRDVNLKQSGTSAAGVFKVIAKTGCDAVNMFDKYSTQLAAVSAWKLANATTGNAITITTVVADPNIKGWTITADSADADYPATATGKMTVNLVGPTALEALGVDGFEGIPLTVLRGA